ncbi:MAG: ribosome biogenesis GTPase Der [Kiritimatiellae bacterium]|nr:ribosome biogenesis GTPase Der [Kiritimatiellia bacterium]
MMKNIEEEFDVEVIKAELGDDAGKGRVVAIVGRPNVGKSAIFNRLAGKRISIVHAERGVTRDRVMREVEWGDNKFELIDTGGICSVDRETTKNRIEAGIHAQVDAAMEDAAVIILVVDVETGVVPLDEEVAAFMRRSGIPIFIAVNKCDNAERDENCDDFRRFGISIFPVSALHNRGIAELMEQVVKELPDVENVTIENPLKVAIVGRPNVGKSSYINRLLRSDRVIVSDIAGTTRDSIDIPFMLGHGKQARHYLLMDTAGIRRIGKIDNSVERFSRFRAEKSIRNADIVVLVLDAVQRPTAQDKKIAAMILEAGKGCMILVNKWDLEEETQRKYGPEIQRLMPFMGHIPVVFASALSGYNIKKSVEMIDYISSQTQADLPTGVLNRTIEEACERVHPPTKQGRSLNIYYATQVGKTPLRIRLFVNNSKIVTMEYRRYLTRILREKFGLEGAPVQLQFRSKIKDADNMTVRKKAKS